MPKSPSHYPRLFHGGGATIARVGRALREGHTSCVQILEGCLDQVDEWESKVHAWVILDRDKALDHARELDDELKAGNDRGPLHGIPIGVKDIIDVAGMPVACGARRWANRIAAKDANVVANLRKAGAVILGKTVTTPYAWIDPPITRNPWNPQRTPGGSSSGSAVAVACGMCHGAIGSQTGGSITRPASFCGVAGMKPTRIFSSNKGVFPLAPSLDHVGSIARSVEDLRSLFVGSGDDYMYLPERRNTPVLVNKPLRLGRLKGFFERRAGHDVSHAFDDASRTLAAAGAEIVSPEDPVDLEQVLINHRIVMSAEAAHTHLKWVEEAPDDYPQRIRELVDEGASHWARDYLAALAGMSEAENALVAFFLKNKLDALITPATIGTAPDRSTTGDPAFNSPWSYTHLPTVSFTIARAADGLPVALQLVGQPASDFELLHVAQWCEIAIWSRRLSQTGHYLEEVQRTQHR